MIPPHPTIFGGNLVVVDSMVIINFHNLLKLDKLVNIWAKKEIVITPIVREEAIYSDNGRIDLSLYISNGSILEENLGEEEKDLFLNYCANGIAKKLIHEGEAACLALAISKGYGLASDEKIIREEFKRICPGKICVNSWNIVKIARQRNLIGEKEAQDLSLGFYYS